MSATTTKKASKKEQATPGLTAPLPQVVIGQLAGLAPDGTPLVDFPGNEAGAPLAAMSAAAVSADAVGREVALLFADGDARRPFVVGLLHQPAPESENEPETEIALEPDDLDLDQGFTARVDGEEVEITAKNQIRLKCGRASITLTRAGKVLIRGAYLLSRSSGANRIKGGSVQIN